MKFTINRDTWTRGKPGSFLCDGSGKMCIVGQIIHQLGVDKALIAGHHSFGMIEPAIKALKEKFPALLGWEETSWVSPSDICATLYAVNDAKDMDDLLREDRIKILMKDLAEIEFIDGTFV